MLCDVQEMLPHPAADSGFGSMLFKARLSTSRLKANLEQEYGVVINFIFKALYEVGTKPISTVSIHKILPVLSSYTLYFEQIGQVCVCMEIAYGMQRQHCSQAEHAGRHPAIFCSTCPNDNFPNRACTGIVKAYVALEWSHRASA